MKKIYYMMLLALLSITVTSCSDWDSPYYIDDIVGSWVSEYGHDYYGDYNIPGYEVVRYDFYSNYTGRYTYYSSYGLSYVDFDWDTRGDRLYIRYYDGDYESLYYGFDDYGYLILSTDYRFHQYTAYRPGGMYYMAPAQEMSESGSKRANAKDAEDVAVKSISRALKARAEQE
jgi:hypothetical protein